MPGKLEELLLEHFASGPADIPVGIGTMTLTRLLNNNWAVPHPGVDAKGERLYAITDAGRQALDRRKRSVVA